MAEINVTPKQITEGIYPQAVGKEKLDIICNYCSKSFYRGLDRTCPDTNWLAEIIVHLSEEHPDRLKE